MANANEFTFQGDGIHADYFPEGKGPIAVFFSYQDKHISKTFDRAETLETPISGLGTVVTVVLTDNPVTHALTSFSVLVPSVGVATGSPQTFKTKGITTVQGATLVERLVFPALQTYKEEDLQGTASLVDLTQ
jgi:hypothetical protein